MRDHPTEPGHPRTIFRRALEHDNLVLAEVTAREIGRVSASGPHRIDDIWEIAGDVTPARLPGRSLVLTSSRFLSVGRPQERSSPIPRRLELALVPA